MATQHFVRRTSRQIKAIERLEPVWNHHEEGGREDTDFEQVDECTDGSIADADNENENDDTNNDNNTSAVLRWSAGFADWRDTAWEKRFKELEEYHAENGHCLVPDKYKPNPSLAGWIWWQRAQRSTMLAKGMHDRIEKLDSIGFVWSVRDYKWEESFQALVSFKAETGHCNVTKRDKTCGLWVYWQRQAYNGVKKRGLTPERIQKLNSIGMLWSGQNNTPKGPKDAAGKSGARFTANGDVYIDVSNRQAELDALRAQAWDEKYQQLCKYQDKTGDTIVPVHYKQDPALAKWVCLQRQKGRAHMMKTGKVGRVQKLEQIGFVWNVTQFKWEERFSELGIFKRENGHCNVPCRSGALGRWVLSQRRGYRTGVLDPELIQRLEKLGFMRVLPVSARSSGSGRVRHCGQGPSKKRKRATGSDDGDIEDVERPAHCYKKIPVLKNPPRGGSTARSLVAGVQDFVDAGSFVADEDDSSLADSSIVGSEENSADTDMNGEKGQLGNAGAIHEMREQLLAKLNAYRDVLLGSLTPESSMHYWNVHKVIQDLEEMTQPTVAI